MDAKRLELDPKWKECRNNISRGTSVFLSAPKNFGKRFFCDYIMNHPKVQKDHDIFLVNLRNMSDKIDYEKLWKDFSVQLNYQNADVKNSYEFINAILNISFEKKILIIIWADQNNKPLSVELINMLQEAFHTSPYFFSAHYTVLVLDDLSLKFYQDNLKSGCSVWDIFESKVCIYPVTDQLTIEHGLTEAGISKKKAVKCSGIILDITGGHHGLIYSAIRFLYESERAKHMKDFTNRCRAHLYTSDIMRSIKMTMSSKKEYTDCALYFRTKRLSTNYEPAVLLEELAITGIILNTDLLRSALTPGIITEFIEGFSESNAAQEVSPKAVLKKNAPKINNHSRLKEVYISYKWKIKEKLISRLYEELNKEDDIRAIIDREDLPYAESISDFMERIGDASYIVIAICDGYLKSEYCMYELYEIYRKSNLETAKMKKKIYPVGLGKIQLNNPAVLGEYLSHWKSEKLKREQFTKEHLENLGPAEINQHEKIKNICNNAGELLSVLKDITHKEIEELSGDQFSLLKKAIRRKNNEQG